MLNVRSVDTNFIAQTWPLVSKYIESSQSKGISADNANYRAEHVLTYLTTGQWLLLVAVDENNEIHGAATMSFINYPLHRVAFITTMGGKLVSGDETFLQLKAIAKQYGATKIQAMARPSMVRFMKQYGFSPVNTLMDIKL